MNTKTIERAATTGMGLVDQLPDADDASFGWQGAGTGTDRLEVGRISSGDTEFVLLRRASARDHVIVLERGYWEQLTDAIRSGKML